jgi:catechol 2,3-dioxygenase-like lactoylglutathione lyase family enzyme
MINGAHAVIYSRDADADRAFFRDVLSLPSVDAGGGWLIFGLPPSEVAIHPTDGEGGTQMLYLLCDDIARFIAAMTERGIACDPIATLGWGLLTNVKLPGGGELGVYQPRHARPEAAAAAKPAKRKATAKKPAARSAKPAAKSAKPAKKKPGKRGSGRTSPESPR